MSIACSSGFFVYSYLLHPPIQDGGLKAEGIFSVWSPLVVIVAAFLCVQINNGLYNHF